MDNIEVLIREFNEIETSVFNSVNNRNKLNLINCLVDNLLIGKLTDDECFIIVNSIYKPDLLSFSRYKNLDFEYINNMRYAAVNNDVVVKDFLLFRFKLSIIDIHILLTVLNAHIAYHSITIFDDSDLIKCLDKIESIVYKKNKRFNAILGCWGELYMLKFLLDLKKFFYADVINAWESDYSRGLHDFTIHSRNLVLEVKTTAGAVREHSFFSLDQLNTPMNNTGLLCSIMVDHHEIGSSCADLVTEIKNILALNNDDLSLIEKKIGIRGLDLCTDNSYKFVVVNRICFFNFDKVPKPEISQNILNVTWSALLSDVQSTTVESFCRIFEPN